MAYPDNLMSRDERVELRKHPHWKTLVLPVVFFVVIIGGGFALAALLRNWEYHSIAWIAIGVIGLLLLIWLSVVPFIRRQTEHFVLTNHHVFFRTGIIHRKQHQIPLSHIQNLETVQTFWGRLLNYGSLIVESAADQPLEFQNVASINRVQAQLNQLIRDDRDWSRGPSDPGRPPAGDPDR